MTPGQALALLELITDELKAEAGVEKKEEGTKLSEAQKHLFEKH